MAHTELCEAFAQSAERFVLAMRAHYAKSFSDAFSDPKFRDTYYRMCDAMVAVEESRRTADEIRACFVAPSADTQPDVANAREETIERLQRRERAMRSVLEARIANLLARLQSVRDAIDEPEAW